MVSTATPAFMDRGGCDWPDIVADQLTATVHPLHFNRFAVGPSRAPRPRGEGLPAG